MILHLGMTHPTASKLDRGYNFHRLSKYYILSGSTIRQGDLTLLREPSMFGDGERNNSLLILKTWDDLNGLYTNFSFRGVSLKTSELESCVWNINWDFSLMPKKLLAQFRLSDAWLLFTLCIRSENIVWPSAKLHISSTPSVTTTLTYPAMYYVLTSLCLEPQTWQWHQSEMKLHYPFFQTELIFPLRICIFSLSTIKMINSRAITTS